MSDSTTLYYIHDPMCSWCWGFQKSWQTTQTAIQDSINIEYIVGGLAPDSDEPMPKDMQEAISGYWKNIQARIPGTEFNYDFWKECTPRRSTYPACRAVLAAKQLDKTKEQAMISAIQNAYYLNAKNPSELSALIDCATSIGLDATRFEQAITSEQINHALMEDISLSRSMGAQGFPSLILKKANTLRPIFIDYNDPNVMIEQIRQGLSE